MAALGEFPEDILSVDKAIAEIRKECDERVEQLQKEKQAKVESWRSSHDHRFVYISSDCHDLVVDIEKKRNFDVHIRDAVYSWVSDSSKTDVPKLTFQTYIGPVASVRNNAVNRYGRYELPSHELRSVSVNGVYCQVIHEYGSFRLSW
jgi:hypothetical protein